MTITEIQDTQIYPGSSNQILGVNNAGTADEYKTLSGTSNEITVTHGVGTITLSTPQAIATSSTPTFASETLTSTTNQLVLGTTRTVTISAAQPATSSRTYTVPDQGSAANFVLDQSNYTISGTWTFSNALTIPATSNQLVLSGPTRTATISAPQPATASRTYTFPDLSGNYNVVGDSGTQTIGGSKTFSSTLTMSGATIAMGSNKITGLANGSVSGDALSWGQSFTSGQITFSPTTTGIKGTTTNDNAAAGNVGEVISASVLQSAGTSLTTGTFVSLTSISLTSGDWDVTMMGGYKGAAGTVLGEPQMGISLTNNTAPASDTIGVPNSSGEVFYDTFYSPGITIGGNRYTVSAMKSRVSIASTTTYYLVSAATFSVSTLTSFGSIVARRVR